MNSGAAYKMWCVVFSPGAGKEKKNKNHLSEVAWLINGKDWIHIILTCYETGQVQLWRDQYHHLSYKHLPSTYYTPNTMPSFGNTMNQLSFQGTHSLGSGTSRQAKFAMQVRTQFQKTLVEGMHWVLWSKKRAILLGAMRAREAFLITSPLVIKIN